MNKTISMPISIYALGGLGEVGKNMYCIENEETIIIIDCGVRFPGVEFPGIDYVVPDFTHLKNNRNKVKALFITHGPHWWYSFPYSKFKYSCYLRS